jgi:hypothetical protein
MKNDIRYNYDAEKVESKSIKFGKYQRKCPTINISLPYFHDVIIEKNNWKQTKGEPL